MNTPANTKLTQNTVKNVLDRDLRPEDYKFHVQNLFQKYDEATPKSPERMCAFYKDLICVLKELVLEYTARKIQKKNEFEKLTADFKNMILTLLKSVGAIIDVSPATRMMSVFQGMGWTQSVDAQRVATAGKEFNNKGIGDRFKSFFTGK
jgi:hypothetical protein